MAIALEMSFMLIRPDRTKAMRTGDKYKTNRMFRRRIYAQGFTILAMVAGSVYWENDRAKRKQFDGLIQQKKEKEKHEAWLRELEIRDQEEQELRRMRDDLIKGRTAEDRRRRTEQGDNTAGQSATSNGSSDSGDSKSGGSVLSAVSGLWPGKK